MGQTAIISPQIIDSTATGRDLITSVDAAAGRAVLELEDASYNWTADHVFEGSIESSAYNFTANQDGQLNQPTLANSIYMRFNNADVYRFNALDFWPVSTGTKNLGRSDHEWGNVYSVDGTFSGTVTAPSVSADNSVYADPVRIRLDDIKGYLYGFSNTVALDWNHTGVKVYKPLSPSTSSGTTCGTDALRWSNVYSVDGSFSGNLNVESGGSQRLYNLGTEGDTDTEYFDISYGSGHDVSISTNATGSGVGGKMYFSTGGSTALNLTLSSVYIYRNFLPSSSSLVCGASSLRWGGVYSVDGDFSGTVTASDIQDSSGAGSIVLTSDGGSLKRFSDSAIQWGFNSILLKGNVEQWNGGAGNFSLGTNSNPWNNGYFIDGSFSGNLNVESGGSQRVYNLGAEGDADTEYLETFWSGNAAFIKNQKTGSGALRSLNFDGSQVRFDVNGNDKLAVLSTSVISYVDVRPSTNGSYSSGVSNARWSNTYSVDGDFSGTTTTAGFRTAILGILNDVTLTTSDHTVLCDTLSNNITVSLPTAVGIDGQMFIIKKDDATGNTVTIDPDGSELIDGAATKVISTAYQALQIQAYNGNWHIVG